MTVEGRGSVSSGGGNLRGLLLAVQPADLLHVVCAREDGNYNVTFYRPWSRVLDVPGADLEIRSEGLRYLYDVFPGGCKGPIGAVR